MRKNCILLAGGKSTRMQTDKLQLKISGKTIFQNALDNLCPFFEKVIVASKKRPYIKWKNVIFVEDNIKGIGPLAGILSGLEASDSNYNFIVSSDNLNYNFQLIEKLYDNTFNYDCVAPIRNSKPEPLYSIYSKSCIEYIKKQIQKEDFKVSNLIYSINSKLIEYDDWSWYKNINTYKDYLSAKNQEK